MNANPPAVPVKITSGLAIWSLVLGILGIVICVVAPLFGIPAIICGHMALARIKNSGGAQAGGGMAIAGLVMGYASFVVILFVALLATIAVPNFVKARDTVLQKACINNLSEIDAAKQQWAAANSKSETDTPTSAELDKYIRTGYGGLRCFKGGTYTINQVNVPPTCSHPGHALSPP